MVSSMEIVVGTYDEVLLGYKILQFEETYQCEQTFTDNSHTGCVKNVRISSKGVLASGSTDETIRLFNLKKRTELGSLVHHSGTVTCLDFYKGQHMFSASEDGTICIWKFFTWECLKTLRGHTKGVNSVSVHPSGKLALSVGKDCKLRTWNLITAKSAYITNLKAEAEKVLWSPDGEHYIVVFPMKLDIYNTQTAEVTCSITACKRVNELVFLNESVIIYGGEGGIVYCYDIVKQRELCSIDTQTNRVRGLSLRIPDKEDKKEDDLLLCTASSDGHIKIFKLLLSENKIDSQLLLSHNTSFRLTCLAVSNYHNTKIEQGDKVKVDKTASVEVKSESDDVIKTELSESSDSGADVDDDENSDIVQVVSDPESDEVQHHKKQTKSKKRKSKISEVVEVKSEPDSDEEEVQHRTKQGKAKKRTISEVVEVKSEPESDEDIELLKEKKVKKKNAKKQKKEESSLQTGKFKKRKKEPGEFVRAKKMKNVNFK